MAALLLHGFDDLPGDLVIILGSISGYFFF